MRWRRAAAELSVWAEAVRLRRALNAGRDAVEPLQGVLAQLRRYARLDGADATSPPSSRATAPATPRTAAAALLTLRLQQVDAWPLPAGEVVGAFARALWSLWGPITGKQALRQCQWREGCARWLPADAHGNRQYCREHQKQALRDRARRVRLRQRPAGRLPTEGRA